MIVVFIIVLNLFLQTKSKTVAAKSQLFCRLHFILCGKTFGAECLYFTLFASVLFLGKGHWQFILTTRHTGE